MKTYDFMLKFAIPVDLEKVKIESLLFEAGCDDALLGTGRRGRLALSFSRVSETAFEAVTSAISEVTQVIPTARLIEVGPDFVGVTDIAELFSFSRQNMRKLLNSHSASFPLPLHEGRSALWHLADVVEWFHHNRKQSVDPVLREVAEASMLTNMTHELRRLPSEEIERLGGS